ncbi:hypothetical protein FG93_05153 [Bosea sp. LC85]|uniref:hypothetical protein n=1 Tax=Bosea sp. LC85 TaxID=1502851 RepID=UPI0004E404AE|nr:hypothetical protein [Bosea sp. LC85]KFC64863.1 hypothetical protein FG93_05153 [Bosea sp. LC85]
MEVKLRFQPPFCLVWHDTGEGQMKQVLDLATRLGLRDTLQALHSELLRQGWGIQYAYRTPDDFKFGGGDRRMLQYEPTEAKQAKNQNARVMRILFSMSSHEEGLAVLLDADEEDRVVGKRLMWIRDASGVKEFIYRSVQPSKWYGGRRCTRRAFSDCRLATRMPLNGPPSRQLRAIFDRSAARREGLTWVEIPRWPLCLAEGLTDRLQTLRTRR